jgi:hypothetical protein
MFCGKVCGRVDGLGHNPAIALENMYILPLQHRSNTL